MPQIVLNIPALLASLLVDPLWELQIPTSIVISLSETQVVSISDAFFRGEELPAVIVPEAGERLSEGNHRKCCHEKISNQKIASFLLFGGC